MFIQLHATAVLSKFKTFSYIHNGKSWQPNTFVRQLTTYLGPT